ncbi:hypothetical protein TEA_004398 [Camellia sinensis var. sinensis]|uniref:Uncharacterized protein n=1 Tax=Camellia sinensis var. sinensis TaxID=542762 RepID=A0A4S4E9A7_CAMSN|nr:hypothetical protein TEA_004398 [Camellia sinensis var. sinensis]
MVVLMTYLMAEWKEDLQKSAAIVNINQGLTFVITLAFAHLASTYVGCFKMVFFSTISYIIFRAKYQEDDDDRVQSRAKVCWSLAWLMSFFCSVLSCKWLDKAAMLKASSINPVEEEKMGRFCTITQVEETKLILEMVPIWMAFLVYVLVKSIGEIFFIEQATKLNGCNKTILALSFKSFLSLAISWFYESIQENMIDQEVEFFGYKQWIDEMWLVPQFCCLGLMEGLAEDGMEMFSCFHVSKRMEGYGKVFTDFVIGMGNFVSAITIYASRRWFKDTLNNSRLDKYYRMLAILSYRVRERSIINCGNGVPCENLGANLVVCVVMFMNAILVLIWADMYAMWMTTKLYLTNVWKLKFTHATAIINVFWGLMGIRLIPMKFIVDVFIGNYWVLVISSFAYSAVSIVLKSGRHVTNRPVRIGKNRAPRQIQGSSLTTVFRVLVAATSKMFHKWPEEADRLYEMVLIFIWSLILVA